MRVVAISVLLLASLAAMAFVPSGSAMSIPPPCQYCAPPHCAGIETVGLVDEVAHVAVDSDCHVWVSVLPRILDCGDPLDGSRSITSGPVTVTIPCGQVDPCEPPMECYPQAEQSSSPPS